MRNYPRILFPVELSGLWRFGNVEPQHAHDNLTYLCKQKQNKWYNACNKVWIGLLKMGQIVLRCSDLLHCCWWPFMQWTPPHQIYIHSRGVWSHHIQISSLYWQPLHLRQQDDHGPSVSQSQCPRPLLSGHVGQQVLLKRKRNLMLMKQLNSIHRFLGDSVYDLWRSL